MVLGAWQMWRKLPRGRHFQAAELSDFGADLDGFLLPELPEEPPGFDDESEDELLDSDEGVEVPEVPALLPESLLESLPESLPELLPESLPERPPELWRESRRASLRESVR
jgi:hypothetical protein